MIPNYIDDTQAAKGNIIMAVCSEHFPQNCRFHDNDGIHRRPIDPPAIFHIKKRRVLGHQLLSLDLQQRQLTASVRRDDAKIDPGKGGKS